MRPIPTICLFAVLLTATSVRASAENETAAPAEDTNAAVSAKTIPVVRFALGKMIVRGRLLTETEDMLHVENVNGSVIGYRRSDIKGLQRRDMPAEAYHEMVGDRHKDNVWDFKDDPDDFARAHRAYEKSLTIRVTESATAKMARLQKEREEWQREMLRRKELEEADARIALLRRQKEALQEQAEAQRDIVDLLAQQAEALRKMAARQIDIARGLERVSERLRAVQRDVDDLETDIARKWGRISIHLKNVDVDRDRDRD